MMSAETQSYKLNFGERNTNFLTKKRKRDVVLVLSVLMAVF
jgi:hypothetical protein